MFALKNFDDPILVHGALKFCKHINKFEKAIIFCTSKRSYSGSPSVRSLESFSNEAYTSRIPHWFKNWQHLRRDKLTASTFASAVGFWPRGRARLWLEKIGAIEPFSGNFATDYSNLKEEEALERYKLFTRNTLSYPSFQVYGERSPEDNWLAASADGVVNSYIYELFINGVPEKYHLSTRGILEIKCPLSRKVAPWRRLPVHYIPQAQGLMEILDRDWMDLYVWTEHGSSLFRLWRDREYWKLLKIALSDFWWKHVQPAKEICNSSVIINPLIELGSLRPAPKHDLHRCIICESKRIVDNSKLIIREIHGRLV